ncbi:MAG: hypothetical protein IPL11_13030 [Candidatus Accumulibacter sp.]|nr:hypothetical protein [Accumulibacter sp.]
MAQFIQALNCLGIRPLLLKGAAVIVGGLYPTDGERMVTDIDVLIPPSSLPDIPEKRTHWLSGNGQYGRSGQDTNCGSTLSSSLSTPL